MDKGLKKAVGKQPTYRLPSNFTYRMMQQVREEAFARERREERRLCLVLTVVVLCALAGVAYLLVRFCGKELAAVWSGWAEMMPDAATLRLFLPTFVSLVCLAGLYRWLEKKMFSRR